MDTLLPKFPLLPLVDGDILVYSCGFAAQKKGMEPQLSHALHNVKNMLIHFHEVCGEPETVNIYLTGKGNFRIKEAVTYPYKGNRDDLNKPIFYKEIKEYLIDYWGAIVIDGMEADDALGINQTDQTCICSVDKDLNMVPGWHYNWKSKTYKGLYYITPDEGLFNFHMQMLIGDPTDNIYAINGIGPKKAYKLLANKTPEERIEVIQNKYKVAFRDNWLQRYNENQKLLWILRESSICRI